MNFKLCLIVFILFFIVSACDKEYVDVKPQMKIVAINEQEQPVEEAKVQLFESRNDWDSLTNIIETKYTDEEGEAVVVKLEERIYYFYVEKGDLNNRQTIATHKDSLKKNEIKTFTITLK